LSKKQFIFPKRAPKKVTPLSDNKQFFPPLLRYASEISANWQNKELLDASHTFFPGREAPLGLTPSPGGIKIRRAAAAVGAFTGGFCNSLSFYH
jgi:hypothetical protein